MWVPKVTYEIFVVGNVKFCGWRSEILWVAKSMAWDFVGGEVKDMKFWWTVWGDGDGDGDLADLDSDGQSKGYMRHFRVGTFSRLCFLPNSGRWIFVVPGDVFSPLFSLPSVFSLEPNRRKQHILSYFPFPVVFPPFFTSTKQTWRVFSLTLVGEKSNFWWKITHLPSSI